MFLQEDIAIDSVIENASTVTQPVMGFGKKVDHLGLELTDVGCFADAVQLLMATFFAFNVQLEPTYDLLETPLKIRKHPRTTVARELLRILES